MHDTKIHRAFDRPFARLATLALATLCALAAADVRGVTIQFDYRFDANGMFAAPERRAALESAAAAYANFADPLAAIEPSGSNTWSVRVTRPDGQGSTTVDDLSVPQGTLVIFVGGWSFHPSVLGFAGSGSIESLSGDTAWQDVVLGRGQSGALAAIPTDFGPWGGAITFNTNVDWHFDPLTDPAATQSDFLTTAMHELGHLLGYGEAGSWFAQVESDGDDLVFVGEHAVAEYGGAVPLDGAASHWGEGTTSTYLGVLQETAMDPSTPRGQRQWMTDLDYAGFADIGWEVVPEPSSLVLATVGVLCWFAVHRRWRLRRDT